MAIKSRSGEIVYNPKGGTKLEANCVLVALGGVEQIEALRALVK